MKNKNKVLVWIVNYNRQPFLKRCLETLFNNTAQPFDLIIYDNNSAQPTKELLKHFEKRKWSNGCTSDVIHLKENIGTTNIYHAVSKYKRKSQFLLKMDNDTQAPENKYWLNEMIEIIEDQSNPFEVIALPTKLFKDITDWTKKGPVITKYGKVLEVPVNVSPLSLFSPKFLKNLKFKKIPNNNFCYAPGQYHEERQIADHVRRHNLLMGYLYKENEKDFLYFLQQDDRGYEEIRLYNQWKEDRKKTNAYKPFELPISSYGNDTSPLNIRSSS